MLYPVNLTFSQVHKIYRQLISVIFFTVIKTLESGYHLRSLAYHLCDINVKMKLVSSWSCYCHMDGWLCMRAHRLPALSRQTRDSVTQRINNMAASNLLPLAVAIVVSLPGVLLL